MVKDLGLTGSGTDVVQASSFDARYPPKCIVDGRMDTFWMATGLYPQQFVLKLPGLHVLDSVNIQCYNIKELCLERSNSSEPIQFELVATKTLQHQASKLQTESMTSQPVTANFLRFRILSGHAPFVSVHRMNISGRETRTPVSMERPPSGEQGTRVIRNAPPPGGLAVGGDRARSVSPAAMSIAPTEHEFLGLPDDGSRPRSQPDPGRASSVAPSMFAGQQQFLDESRPGGSGDDVTSVQGAFNGAGMLPDSEPEPEQEPEPEPEAAADADSQDDESVGWR